MHSNEDPTQPKINKQINKFIKKKKRIQDVLSELSIWTGLQKLVYSVINK